MTVLPKPTLSIVTHRGRDLLSSAFFSKEQGICASHEAPQPWGSAPERKGPKTPGKKINGKSFKGPKGKYGTEIHLLKGLHVLLFTSAAV